MLVFMCFFKGLSDFKSAERCQPKFLPPGCADEKRFPND